MNIFTLFETEFETILHSLQDQGDLPADLDSGHRLPRDLTR